MKLDAGDLKKIAPGVAALLVLGAIGGAMAAWSLNQSGTALREYSVSESRFREAERRLREVNLEEEMIRANSARYRQLVDRGIIGQEQRLDWVETISDIRKTHRLFEVDYEFAPRRDLGGGAPPFRFSASAMKLRLPMLHEEDLFRFLDGLRERAPAHVRARQCSMERIPGSEGSALTPHLTAHCSLEWITIQPAALKAGGLQ